MMTTVATTLLNLFVLASDGTKVYFDHYKNNHKNVIIIAHGFYNSKEAVLLKQLANDLLPDYDCILMDFRGHGKSKGLFHWTSKEYLDLEAVLRYAHQSYEHVGLIGFSLGAATSLITASKCDMIDSLIAVSAPTAFDKIEYHLWKLDIENDIAFGLFKEGGRGKGVRPGPFWMPKERPVEIVQKIKAPVCYIHGDKDWLIYPWHSNTLYEKTLSPKKIAIIKNGPHAEYLVRKSHDEFLSVIRDWLSQTLH